MVTPINGSTFLSDSIIFVRNVIRDNITDPLGKNGSMFVFTSYPRENITYPVVTVRHRGMTDIRRLGMQSQGTLMSLPIEIRVWSKNEKHRDLISQDIYYFLKNNQLGQTGSVTQAVGLHDFTLTSTADIDEDGDEGIKSRVMEYTYLYMNSD